MKKQLLLIVWVFLSSALFVGCDEDDGDLDFEQDVPLVIRFENGSESINVDDEIVFEVGIEISREYDSPVTLHFDVVSNTLIEGQDFETISPGMAVIPAGQKTGKILFSGVDGVFDDGDKSFLINITGADVAGVSGTVASYPTLQVVFNGCPTIILDSSQFSGDYQVTVLTDPGPFGAAFEFENDIVSLSVGDGANDRSFTAVYLPGQGIDQPAVDISFTFDICGEISLPSGQNTNLQCGGSSIFIGPTSEPGSYDFAPLDDSSFMISFVEFEQPACGISNPYENIYLFEKL